MGPIQVVVQDGNNLVLEVTPTPNTTVILDRGVAGTAATIAVGTTTSLAPGSPATVTNVGTSTAAVFNFGIPQSGTAAGGANTQVQFNTSGALAGSANMTFNGTTFNALIVTENSSPVVVQTDIGTAPNEIPLNQYLGNLAYQDARSIAGQVGVISGTAAAPSITPSTNTNTGIFFPATDTIAFAEGGVEAMRINNAGNLGLGVTPSTWGTQWKAAQVNGASLYGNSSFTVIGQNIVGQTASDNYIATGFASRYIQSGGAHQFFTAPSGTAGNAISFTQAMTLDASGNLGIGTTSPAQRLDVNGNFRFANFTSGATSGFFGCADTGSITLNFGGTTTPQKGRIFYSDNSDFFSFSTNSTERMRLDSSGNLIQSAPTTPPTLATNGQMVFNLTSNTNLRVSVRGSDGVTRTANITLA